MKIGNNLFTVLVTDISGSEVTGISASDFIIEGSVNNDIFTNDRLQNVIETSTDGIYNLEINFPNRGQGYLKVTTSNPANIITPDFYNLEISNNSIDDVYNRVAINFLDVTTASDSLFVTTRLTTKEGDDTIFLVDTNRILTDFTDYKATIVKSNVTAVSGDNIVGDMDIENVEEETGIVTLKIPFILTEGLIPEGQNRRVFYSDLQARDAAGNRITLAVITINLLRQFTIG